MVTGKGGIGKTLVAACLGQAASELGRRSLIVESSNLDQLAPLFGTSTTRHVVTGVGDRLFTVNLNAADNLRDFVVKHLGQEQLFDMVVNQKLVQSLAGMTPGLAELMMLGRLYYESELAPVPRKDFLVFDGPASGHFLSLMTTTDAVLRSEFGGAVTRETSRVRGFLADPQKVGIVYVTTPEDLVISEALDFLPRLRDLSPAKLLGIALNRMPTWSKQEKGGLVHDYLNEKLDRIERAKAKLYEGMKARGIELPVWELPELGFVDEPLAAGFGAGFLQRMLEES
ncbi:hypothetical protein E3A20_12950 [Planctomyces bekefii]|uniref:arsenite-transporting ATPase n=1 Tax=Planctomyces bekefii TaxID=1653850 RepID=A0A5C6M4D8_9PLAN|nr:hypothetical protein E3A20_12950 [Planctomyces bekefii]